MESNFGSPKQSNRSHANVKSPELNIELLHQFLDSTEASSSTFEHEFNLPTDSHDTDLFLAPLELAEGRQWCVCLSRQGKHRYLARGSKQALLNCVLFGSPENICADAALDRAAVLEFISLLPNIENLPKPFRWLSFQDMYPDRITQTKSK
jgi:hypothetical protein